MKTSNAVRLVRFLVGLFFRRIEVSGAEHVPPSGGGILIAWHPNGLVDPALIISAFPRPVVFGARHGLFRWPLIGRLMCALGTVPIYRATDLQDGDVEARRKANRESLDALAQAVCDGRFAALFPEGVSHDDPFIQELKTGAARLYTAAQMDAFEQANPGTAFLVFVLEDDDAACEIRTDEDRSGAVLKALGQVYKDYKAAKDQKVLTPTGATRILTAAKSAADFLSALHSFLNSNDDIVGFAVENGVTGLSHPVANWAVLDESKRNGWIKLEMR